MTNVAEEPVTYLITVYEEWETDLLSATIIRIAIFFCLGRCSCGCRQFYCCLGNEEPSCTRSSLLCLSIHLACVSFVMCKSVSSSYRSTAIHKPARRINFWPDTPHFSGCPTYTHFILSMRSASLTCGTVQSLIHNLAFLCSFANSHPPELRRRCFRYSRL